MSETTTPRTFNAAFGNFATGIATGAWSQSAQATSPQAAGTEGHPRTWTRGTYRRVMVDSKVPDWDAHLLANLDATEYFRMIHEMLESLRTANPADVFILAPEFLSGRNYYARMFPNSSGPLAEESDRYAQALFHKKLAGACFAQACEVELWSVTE